MAEAMDNPVMVKGDLLRIPVDSSLGRSWKDVKG